MRRLKKSAERAATATSSSHHGLASTTRFNASRRIPSWNVIARENSTGSLDDLVADNNLHASSGRNLSDSETESVDLSSWTRSGGPLMRTASANKFIDFVQSLDIDIALARGFSSSPNSPAVPPGGPPFSPSSRSMVAHSDNESNSNSNNTSSITVTEGDLLQPERTSNGFVLNVVKRENLGMSIGNQNTELPESVQLDIPEKEMDNSSVSEHEVDEDDDDDNEEEHNGSISVTISSEDSGLQEPVSGSVIDA